MYRIDKVNLDNNPKFNQGFKDSNGKSELKSPDFDIHTIIIDKENQSIDVNLIFENDSFKQMRTFHLDKTDLNKAALDEVKSLLGKVLNYVLNQPEFSEAVLVKE